ncbi:MAG: hypothetical protein HYV38_02560 [Candidatus Levybacteria bacterium]|nr:hypothetical protein [Candidatus Levybacteria bacterium]
MNKLDQIVKPLENLYAKAPALPVGAREFIVSVTPWLSLIFGVLTVLASLSAFGISAISSPLLALGGTSPVMLMLIAVFGLVEGVLMVVAFPSLRKKLLKGWNLIFLVELISIVDSIFSFNPAAFIVDLIVAAIVFYFLFQIKPYYKK